MAVCGASVGVAARSFQHLVVFGLACASIHDYELLRHSCAADLGGFIGRVQQASSSLCRILADRS